MSKGNMFLGHARGKVGSVVFSRQNGKQITRSRAEVIKNPRTYAQFIQRVFLNTCSQAYSYAKPIVDHSFQGKSAGQECMSEFMKKNLEYLRQRVAQLTDEGVSMDSIYNFVPVGASGLYPGRWIIANGQLPQILPTISAYTTIGSAKAIMDLPENTYQSVIDKYGLQRGDQITFVTVEAPVDGSQFYLNYCRVILDPREEDGTAAALSTAFVGDGGIQKPNPKNEGGFQTLTFDASLVRFSLTNGDVASVGIIVSREENGVWKRSKSQMVLNEDVMMASGDFYSIYRAIEASQGVTIDVLNALYLNNAGTSGYAVAGGGSTPTPSPTPSPSADPSANAMVNITAAGATAEQSVAGGSVSVVERLTKVEISGNDLTEGWLKAGTENNAATATNMTLTGTTKATWQAADAGIAAGGTLYVFKNGALWFTVSVTAGGDAPLDEG